MKEVWLKHYEALLNELETCKNHQPFAMAEIECSFNLAQKFWSRVQADLENHDFISRDEEIEFYKEIKPLFKSQIEYYNLLYQAEILKPTENTAELKEFWAREQMKLDKFINENAVFYAYYQSAATHRDYEYFLTAVQDDDSRIRVYADDLIATLLALEKFSIYSKIELSKL
jgi:hypothetical protein